MTHVMLRPSRMFLRDQKWITHVMLMAMPNVLIRPIRGNACYAYGHAECFNKANKRKRMFCLWPRRMF